MKSPILKNALLCRIPVYVVVLDDFMDPIIIENLKYVPEAIKVIAGIGLAAGRLLCLQSIFILYISNKLCYNE